jgi:ParB family transcriptional regulator, chromosome partitioning protein
MKTVDIDIEDLKPASWNPNRMDEDMTARLKESISRYGLVEPLVVREKDSSYEVLSGNQRLKVLQDMNFKQVPCVVVNLDDAGAMLLAQALNGLKGEDDFALKGALLKQILSSVSEDEILSLLPETTESLKSLSTINEIDLAEHLQAWDKAQLARLRHMQLQFTDKQLEVVEEAVSSIIPKAKDESFGNPNTRGNAVFLLCKFYLDRRKPE